MTFLASAILPSLGTWGIRLPQFLQQCFYLQDMCLQTQLGFGYVKDERKSSKATVCKESITDSVWLELNIKKKQW